MPTLQAELAWDRSYSREELSRIRNGLIPDSTEDKWFMYFHRSSLNVHRSWTGACIYIVDFDIQENGASVAKVCVNRDRNQYRGFDDAYELQMLAFLIGNLLLGGNFPFPIPDKQEESSAGVFQHNAAGTGYPEVRVSSKISKRPWWKIW